MKKSVYAVLKIEIDRVVRYSFLSFDYDEAWAKFEEMVRDNLTDEDEIQEALNYEGCDLDDSSSIVFEYTSINV